MIRFSTRYFYYTHVHFHFTNYRLYVAFPMPWHNKNIFIIKGNKKDLRMVIK
jgi:hypothetical protein